MKILRMVGVLFAELNGFLSSHRVLRVRDEIVVENFPGTPSPSSAYSVSMPSRGSALPGI